MVGVRQMAALLSTTCLTTSLFLTAGAGPAQADGGTGGSGNNGVAAGGAGGSGANGASGNPGAASAAGSGGGGGGAAGGGSGGGGGQGGSGNIGGDGGNGGPNGWRAPNVNNTGSLNGTAGGVGGNGIGSALASGGGGGGAGGYGAIVTSNTGNTNSGSITGGNGGSGGSGQLIGGNGGNGGAGGIGVQFTVSGATFTNTGTITGGNGGSGGEGIPAAGAAGAGGVGVVGLGTTIVNAGTISGGTNGLGSPGPQPNAITFAGGTNVLELWSGSTINGNVQANTTADRLRLGGSANASFDVSQIGSGAQYRGFGLYEKTGSSTWTLTGTTTDTTPWTVSAGTLAISSNGNLGANAGTLTLAGGTLKTMADINSTRSMTLGSGTDTIETQSGTTMAQGGAIGGSGGLTKTGEGSLSLNVANSYSGGTVINGGRVLIAADDRLGNVNGGVTLNGGTLHIEAAVVLAGTRAITLGSAGGTIETTTGGANTISQSISGDGGLTKSGPGTLILSGNNVYTGGTTVSRGTLQLGTDNALSATGALTVSGNSLFDLGGFRQTVGRFEVSGGIGGVRLENGAVLTAGDSTDTTINGFIIGNATGSFVKQGSGTMTLTSTSNSYGGGTTINAGALQVVADRNLGSASGSLTLNGGTLKFGASFDLAATRALTIGSGGGTFDTNGFDSTITQAIGGSGGLTKAGGGTLVLAGANTYSGGTVVSGGTLQGTTTSLQGNVVNNANVTFSQATAGIYAGSMSGTGSLTVLGGGTLTLTGTNSYSGGTVVSAGTLQGTTTSLQGNIANNANITFNQAAAGTYAGNMSGTGALTVQGGGAITLTGTNTYSGGTSVLAGALIGNSSSLQGNILNNGSVTFNQTGGGIYAGTMSGTGSLVLQGGGSLTVTGANTYTGPTTVNGSLLVVNGSLASTVTLSNGGTLGGSGNIGTLVVSNGATLAPGNSIGTLTVNGNLLQTGGTYAVEVNAQGQSDRVNVNGTATISGGSVAVLAQAGTYATSTTYTILSATGGVTGAYASVSSNYAFLTPSLSYTANSVLLTLGLQGSTPFSGFGGNTNNQRAVGSTLDRTWANASGDFATVIGALANLSTAQAGPALNSISGQPYANFGSFNVANNALFMNTLGQQMALARGAAGDGRRQSLAEACEIAACDGASPFSVWASALGGVGSIMGNGNAGAFSYNLGGTAAGIDYRVTPNLLLGLAAGYTSGTQWVNGFQGKGWSDSLSVAAYGSFTQGNAYADALAGYGYSNNRMQRQIPVAGLQPRTANGSTGANQFLGQAEAGYRLAAYAPAQATVTPFARFQASSINQAGFSEWGANSLSLDVQQQTTTSLRSTLGADLAGAIKLSDNRTVELGMRLGWLHEYANTVRPVTAAFAGAPTATFTVLGATPQRDSAVIGFEASTKLAAGTQLFLRYDGDIGSGADNHALNVGLRMSW